MSADENELDNLVRIAQEGIEIDAFIKSPAGKLIYETSRETSRTCLAIILSAASSDADVEKAVQELRIQHRMLDPLTKAISRGLEAERAIKFHESPTQSYDYDNEEPV